MEGYIVTWSKTASISECGKVQRRKKIVGGSVTEVNEYPWQARLEAVRKGSTDGEFFCSGSLITDRWVLTAAHCVIE